MRAIFQLLGAVTAVAAAGLGVAVLAKKLGKEFPVKVTVDVAEDAEQDEEAADKTAAAYEAGVAAGKAHAEAIQKAAEAGRGRSRRRSRRGRPRRRVRRGRRRSGRGKIKFSFSQKLYNCPNPAARPAESARESGRFFAPLSVTGSWRTLCQLPHGGAKLRP